MEITRIRLALFGLLLLTACSSGQQIDDRLTFRVLQAQIQQEARFDRSDPSEEPKIKLVSVEVTKSELLPKLVESDRDKYRTEYTAQIEVLEDCSWGTSSDNPNGFTRYYVKPYKGNDAYLAIYNIEHSKAGSQKSVTHYFDLVKTEKGWLDEYGNYY